MKAQGLKWLGLLLVLTAGFLMVTPSAFAASGNGYSAVCKDGTAWSGKTKRGACRGHKGIKSWISEGGASASETKATHERKSRRSKKAEEAGAAGAATNESASTELSHSRKSRGEAESAVAGGAMSATCKDGTTWSGESKRGACRGHKGVASWSGAEAAASPTVAAAPTANAGAGAVTNPRRASTRTASTGGSLGAPAPGGGNGKVWVNTGSKTYHCPGSKWYGTTKHGEYMTEAEAKAQGYHADHGKTCSG